MIYAVNKFLLEKFVSSLTQSGPVCVSSQGGWFGRIHQTLPDGMQGNMGRPAKTKRHQIKRAKKSTAKKKTKKILFLVLTQALGYRSYRQARIHFP